jgi:hypothetical protein
MEIKRNKINLYNILRHPKNSKTANFFWSILKNISPQSFSNIRIFSVAKFICIKYFPENFKHPRKHFSRNFQNAQFFLGRMKIYIPKFPQAAQTM